MSFLYVVQCNVCHSTAPVNSPYADDMPEKWIDVTRVNHNRFDLCPSCASTWLPAVFFEGEEEEKDE